MEVVFLDQNKWIELAKVEAGQGTPEVVALYEELSAAVAAHRVIFPLTVSHILETSKRNDPRSRWHVATVQARLSNGRVFRCRKARLLIEIRHAVQRAFGEHPVLLPDNWTVVPGFMQAFDPFDEMVASPADAARTRLINTHIDPKQQYLDYMANQDDQTRRTAHATFAKDSDALVSRIEARRRRLKGVPVDLRRRVYAANLFYDHQDYLGHVLKSLGRTIDELKEIGSEAIVTLFENVPTLDVESRIAARLEAQSGNIRQNDIRDMSSFCVALPYAERIIAEKVFVAISSQAKLGSRYNTSLETSLGSLAGVYT